MKIKTVCGGNCTELNHKRNESLKCGWKLLNPVYVVNDGEQWGNCYYQDMTYQPKCDSCEWQSDSRVNCSTCFGYMWQSVKNDPPNK